MSAAQTNYGKIILQFSKLNFNQDSKLHQRELKQALDTICQKNAGIPQFNPEVAEELWNECEKNNDGSVTLRSFVSIIVRAQSILKDNIAKAEQELASGIQDDDRKRQLLESIGQYEEDLKLLSVPFQVNLPSESRKSYKLNASMSRASNNNPNQSGLDQSGLFSARSSGIFADVPSKRQTSSSLKWTFIITVFLFALELIICFHKNHFYNTLVYIMIFSIVLLGYFDKYYMKFILANLIISIGLDFLWLIVQASPYWNPEPPTHHSTIQTPFLRFMYFFVIILMLAKVLLVILFFRYRNNEQTVRKSVVVWGNTFEINGRINQNNPISKLLAGKGIFSSTIPQQ